jgi:hypothetical protein
MWRVMFVVGGMRIVLWQVWHCAIELEMRMKRRSKMGSERDGSSETRGCPYARGSMVRRRGGRAGRESEQETVRTKDKVDDGQPDTLRMHAGCGSVACKVPQGPGKRAYTRSTR